jgi:hypothetical protein
MIASASRASRGAGVAVIVVVRGRRPTHTTIKNTWKLYNALNLHPPDMSEIFCYNASVTTPSFPRVNACEKPKAC